MSVTWKQRSPALLLIVFAVIGLAACSGPEGNAEEGARWYTMHNCYACHGKHGNDGRTAKISGIDQGFSSFVRYLRNPSSPSMPKFPESRLSKEDAADIYVWLKTMPK